MHLESKTPLDFEAIAAKLRNGGARRLWHSLEEVACTPEYEASLQDEFPNDPEPNDPEKEPPSRHVLNRREVLKLMAASAALSGLTACTKLPTEKIVPYVRAPEEVIPGKPLFYATSMTDRGIATGLLVESHMGRPTKVEGNPEHPGSLGSTNIFCQASVLSFWDPDRSQVVLREGRISDWPEFLAMADDLRANLSSTKGEGLRILTETTSSPTLGAQIRFLLEQFPNAKWYAHEPCGNYPAHQGARLAFGRNLNSAYRFDKAAVVTSLDSDFLNDGAAGIRYARDFSNWRGIETPQAQMNRLYIVESTPSLTGAMADHRLPIRCGEIELFARALAAALDLPLQSTGPGGSNSHVPDEWLKAVAGDLQSHRGTSLVVAGISQPPAVHALAHAMNAALGNVGQTVVYTDPLELSPENDSLPELVKEIEAGQVSTLFILGSNPVFTAPADLQFAQQLLKVPLRIHCGLYDDETGELCHWHIPQVHFLESWSDARAYDGTVGIVQPLIAPLYHGHSFHELLALLNGDVGKSDHDLVRDYWRTQRSQPSEQQFESFWETTLHDGVMVGTALSAISPKLTLDYGKLPDPPALNQQAIEVVFRPDPTIGDGRWANNAWLQELPKPLTKVTWDNAIALSPTTAWRLGLTTGDVANLNIGGLKASGPVWALPGHADNSATVTLGYGRRRAGHVGTGFGLNGYLLRTSAAPSIANGLQIQKTGQNYLFAETQIHHPIDRKNQQLEEESENAFDRDLVRIATLEEFRKNPQFAKLPDKDTNQGLSLYQPYKYEGYAWGMSVDLSRCTGCEACVVACYSENNIAVVGKYEVMAGRDMQWIRVDNYYRGDLENPETYFQPLPCMQCEQAPCELVCPVGATLHDREGLNQMVYNRCVGTRYCSNNCPYKVRRFNFKLYSDWVTPSLYGLRNPDVTVRSRGVMEKCTYCVQRINEAKINAEKEDRSVRDGEILTACQQACPTQAIVFGNINDPNSRVSKLKQQTRDYSLLAELNTRPRTTYLAKLRNPNPEISAT
jgi:MoCo/4Fe-4S cofactor protein with predicted Tat translocation signal